MADITDWSSWTELVAPTTIAMGSGTGRATLDLTDRLSGRLRINTTMLGTTVPGASVDLRVKRLAGASGGADTTGIGVVWGMSYKPTGTIANTTISGDTVAVGDDHLHVASISNFAQGDLIAVFDSSFDRLEFHEVVGTATGLLYIDSRAIYEHTAAQADAVYDSAGGWDVFLPGGAVYEVTINYRAATTGSNVAWQVLYQTEDYV